MDLYESRLRRRALLGAAGLGVGALVLGSCGNTATRLPAPLPTSTGVPNTGTSTGARTPQTVTQTGTVHEFSLTAAPTEVEIGGQRVSAWAYNGQVPGPEIRVTEGDTLRIALTNRLPEDTSIHWHGLAIPNAMDGVPGVTQPPITSGKGFLYEFIAPQAGTYMYHPHTGLQLDRGLYGPLIVEPRSQIQRVDREYTLMFDDWLDATPEDTLRQLKATGDRMGGMGGTTSGRSGMAGARGSTTSGSAESPPDVVYPRYLVNGTSADAPQELTVNEGETVRLRFINPSSATIYGVALPGHTFTVTHADGQPVEPREVDTVRIGMGERYDVLVQAIHSGVWQLAARVEGTTMLARTVLRYQGDASPAPAVSELPRELAGRLLTYGMLTSTGPVAGRPDTVVPVRLSGGMGQYVWMMNGQVFPKADLMRVGLGCRIRFELQNMSMMPHPMHLHGHLFQVENDTGRGPMKDTVLVEPMQTVTIDWVANNPGTWAFHCHNLYHGETGMMRLVHVA